MNVNLAGAIISMAEAQVDADEMQPGSRAGRLPWRVSIIQACISFSTPEISSFVSVAPIPEHGVTTLQI